MDKPQQTPSVLYLAKTASVAAVEHIYLTNPYAWDHLSLWTFVGCCGIRPNVVHSCIRHSRRTSTVGFASATVQLICLALGVNRYLAQIMCKMQVVELLLTLSLPKVERSNSLLQARLTLDLPASTIVASPSTVRNANVY